MFEIHCILSDYIVVVVVVVVVVVIIIITGKTTIGKLTIGCL